MIYLGEQNKRRLAENYAKENGIKKIFIIGDNIDGLDWTEAERISFSQSIEYRYFYRWLQEIGGSSLLILNEALRRKNRHDLAYNCMRRYAIQTQHRMIFNYYPIIDAAEDVMILHDFLQDNPFFKVPYKYMTKLDNIRVGFIDLSITEHNIQLTEDVVRQYEAEKQKVFNAVKKDPDIIPRRLLKFSEKHKNKQKPGLDSLSTMKPRINVGVSQLKVDKYYLGRLYNFRKETQHVIEKIQC